MTCNFLNLHFCGGFGAHTSLTLRKKTSFWGTSQPEFQGIPEKSTNFTPPTHFHNQGSKSTTGTALAWSFGPTSVRLNVPLNAGHAAGRAGNGWKINPFSNRWFFTWIFMVLEPIFVRLVFFGGVQPGKSNNTHYTVKKQLRSNQDVVKITGGGSLLIKGTSLQHVGTTIREKSECHQFTHITTHIPENARLELEGHGGLLQMFLLFFGFQKCDFQDPCHSYNSKQKPNYSISSYTSVGPLPMCNECKFHKRLYIFDNLN